jgi:hypothetical protein
MLCLQEAGGGYDAPSTLAALAAHLQLPALPLDLQRMLEVRMRGSLGHY